MKTFLSATHQKMVDISATTADRTKLRMGYLLIILNVLGFILAIIAIRSDLFHRSEKDSTEKATTRVTLWKVIHCEIPAAAPSPNEKKEKKQPRAINTTTTTSTKKKNLTSAHAEPSVNHPGSSASSIVELTTQQCSYDTISDNDINWSTSLIQKFHAVLGLTILSLVCRCSLLMFVVVVGGNVLKLFRFLHHDGNYHHSHNNSSPNNSGKSKEGGDGSFASAAAVGLVEGNGSLVESLAVSKGNARVLRMHTCEGLGVLICYSLHLLSTMIVLGLLLSLWTSTSVADIESALQLHARSTDYDTVTAANNDTTAGDDDLQAQNSSQGGFKGADFSMRLGFVIWVFYGFFELIVSLFALLPFSCILKWGSRPSHLPGGLDLALVAAGGGGGSFFSSRRSGDGVGTLEQLEEAFLPTSPMAARDTTTDAPAVVEMVSTSTASSVPMPAVDFDKSISREASSILPIAAAAVYVPRTTTTTTTEKLLRIKQLEAELAVLKGTVVDSALLDSSSPLSSVMSMGGVKPTPSIMTPPTSQEEEEGEENSRVIHRTITESSI